MRNRYEIGISNRTLGLVVTNLLLIIVVSFNTYYFIAGGDIIALYGGDLRYFILNISFVLTMLFFQVFFENHPFRPTWFIGVGFK